MGSTWEHRYMQYDPHMGTCSNDQHACVQHAPSRPLDGRLRHDPEDFALIELKQCSYGHLSLAWRSKASTRRG
jgi:hypothetical protein